MANELVVAASSRGELIVSPGGHGSMLVPASDSMPGPSVIAHQRSGAVTPSSPMASWSDQQHVRYFGGLLAGELSAVGITDVAVVQKVSSVALRAYEVAKRGGSATRVHVLGLLAEGLIGEDSATIRAAVEAGGLYLEQRLAEELEAEGSAEYSNDDGDCEGTRTAMQAEWGSQYEANVTLCTRYLDALPPAVQMAFENARLDDGTKVLNTPSVLRWLTQQARGATRTQPSRSVLSNASSEKREIEALMAKPGSRYWRGPDAEHLQARYREILESEVNR